MKKTGVSPQDLQGVFAVPPLARRDDPRRTLDFSHNGRIVQHIASGGVTRLLYGGNAFLYHITLNEYEQLVEWLARLPDHLWCIPSAGPSYGRAMDQAPVLRKHGFPLVMMLPCGDPRDANGLERGLREFAEAAETRLMLYCKSEADFGPDKEAGLDAIGRLADEGICVAVKYAVVRDDPHRDAYLEGLLRRVDRRIVISGIGERPAIVHMRDWQLPGFTTGSGCIAPTLSNAIFKACQRGNFEEAAPIRENFLPLEDLRDAWGPARVLHRATALAGIAATGSLPPYLSEISEAQEQELAPVAKALLEKQSAGLAAATA
ncbi:MAG: dihydrodipicolinate synthase family protein [Bryobacteraceae bacterium]